MPNLSNQFDTPAATAVPRDLSAADFLDAQTASDFLDGKGGDGKPSFLDTFLKSILTAAPAPQQPQNAFDSVPVTSNVVGDITPAGNAPGVATGNNVGQSQGATGTGLSDDEMQRALSFFGLGHKVPPEPFVKSIQDEDARQIALDQPMAAVGPNGKISQEVPKYDPKANEAEFAKLWQVPTDVTRAALTDAETTALLPVTYPLYGAQGIAGMQASLPTALDNAFRDTETDQSGDPLPVDVQLTEISKTHPVLATAGKVGQGVAGSFAFLPLGGAAPAWIQKLLALGFSAQMIAGAGSAARTLGTELGKNPEDRDNDTITSAVSDLVQDFGFAPIAGLDGARDIIERYADKPMFVIRKLSDQLRGAPILPPVNATDLEEKVPPASVDSEIFPSQSGGAGVENTPITPAASEPQDALSSNGEGGLDHETTQAGINDYQRSQKNVPPVQIVNDPTWTHNGYGVRGTVQDGQIIVNRAFIDNDDTLRKVLGEEHNHLLLSSDEGREFIRYAGGSNLGDDQYSMLAKQYPRQSGESVADWKARLTDEYIAKAGSENVPFWREIVERVKTWLARKGIGQLSDEETARAIMRALKAGKTADEFAPRFQDISRGSDDAGRWQDDESDLGDSLEEDGPSVSRYNLTDEPLQGMSVKRATEAMNQLFETKKLPAAIRVLRDRMAPEAATIRPRGAIALNATKVSTPEQAQMAILDKGLREVWYEPDVQKAWQQVRSNVTQAQLTAASKARQAQGLRTDFGSVQDGAAIARLINSDGRSGDIGGFHNAIRGALRARFGFNVPATARPFLKDAAVQFLRNRTVSPPGFGLPPNGFVPLGQWGEAWLGHVLGGRGIKPSTGLKTSLTYRFQDRLFNNMYHESKAGLNVELGNKIRTQILKDAELVHQRKIKGVHWHFFQGAQPDVLNFLEQNGIPYTVY